jgi:eukaryotic-like serine/threonine-protein kinase
MKTLVGKTLQKDKYLIEQQLGQGGFGITYKAIHQILNQPVVIKTIRLTSQKESYLANLRQQFLDEAQRLLKCSHLNIVRFHEFFLEEEVPYIVMDYIPGKSLDTIVLPNNPLPEAIAIDYIRQVGEAVKEVHKNGLLHRDIKPQNLILSEDTQQVVLIDFGIAREFSPGVTQTQTNYYSEGYAPIEQYLPKARRGPASDVYSLAATLYTLLTAQIPISSSLRNRFPLASPQDLRPDLSIGVSQAVMKGMEIDSKDRPDSVEKWLTLLSKVENEPHKSVVLMGSTSKVPTKKLNLNPSFLGKGKSNKRRWYLVAPIALVSLGLGLSYAWPQVQTIGQIPANLFNTNKTSSSAQSHIFPTSTPESPQLSPTSTQPSISSNISVISNLPEPITPTTQSSTSSSASVSKTLTTQSSTSSSASISKTPTTQSSTPKQSTSSSVVKKAITNTQKKSSVSSRSSKSASQAKSRTTNPTTYTARRRSNKKVTISKVKKSSKPSTQYIRKPIYSGGEEGDDDDD